MPLHSNIPLSVAGEHGSKFTTNLMSDSASSGLGNLKMPAFIERSAVPRNMKRVNCDPISEDFNVSDHAEDSEDDELLTVHFGNAATICAREEIIIDSEEESSESSLFLCSVCAVVCKDLNSLKQHERNHSGKIGTTSAEAEIDEDIMFVCSVCTVVCADLQSLKRHEKTHSGEICTAQTEPQNDQDFMFVCKVCTVVCGDMELLKQHAKTHLEVVPITDSLDQDLECPEKENSDNNMFICSVCTIVCTNLNSLKEHEKTHSEEICTMQTEPESDLDVMFMCSVCTVVCGDLHSLKQHEKTHLEEPTTYSQDKDMAYTEEDSRQIIYVCSVCTLMCSDLQSLNQHKMTHSRDWHTLHSRQKLYPGDLNNQFSEPESESTIMCGNSYSFKRPEILHSGAENMDCFEPDNSISSEAKISEDGKYECNVCYMIFKNLPSLLHHEMLHSDDRPYKCSLCNYAGKLQENLVAHMNTHTRGKQFKCQYCDYTSLKSHSLKLHLQFHTDQHPHKCSLCLYSTACLSSLTSHYRNHHHTIDKNVKNLAFSKSRGGKLYPDLNSGVVKWHKCEFCDYGTKKAYSLRLHLQAHTDKFPNKCHLCLYSTANPGNLTSHYKNHHLNDTEGQNNTSAEELEPTYISETSFEDVSSEVESPVKPYKCQYCEYSAAKPHKVRAHMVHHTDKFPNKCHLCVYSTARSGNLLYHYKYHHQSNGLPEAVSAEAEPSEPVTEKWEQELNWLNNVSIVERAYKCNRCEYTAIKPHRIKEHSLHHNYDYKYKCRLCVFSTANLANLNSHCRKHHSSITEADRSSSLKYKLRILTIPLERIARFTSCFICDICQKTFTTRSVLIEHKNTHSQMCQYKCDICECSFYELELLETHKRSHQRGEISQHASSSEIRNSGLLCKIKLTPMKGYPLRSVMSRVRNMHSKFQSKKRKSVKTSSLQITADKLQQRCRLVLYKLDKGNTMKNKIQCQSRIASVDKTESSVSFAGSNKDQRALEASTTEVVQQYGKGMSLKSCVVQLENTKPETLRKIQLHRCLLCEFASTSPDSLKVHADSHLKEETSPRSRREVKHKTDRRLKSHIECSNKEDISLSSHSESSLKKTDSLKSYSTYHTLHHCLSENEDGDVASRSNNTDFYKCVLCSCKSGDLESMTKHMLTCNTKKGLW